MVEITVFDNNTSHQTPNIGVIAAELILSLIYIRVAYSLLFVTCGHCISCDAHDVLQDPARTSRCDLQSISPPLIDQDLPSGDSQEIADVVSSEGSRARAICLSFPLGLTTQPGLGSELPGFTSTGTGILGLNAEFRSGRFN